ncbi:MAG: prepilin-type N-terminal cleavage/methylation domain-containing protein [bacterium]|nr:prepilin-type N-terminal cleavage/methylation domain-containing protein [bacterium]
MKDKGFTLIELLAVIVILAIIALIAVPIIIDIIEDSKKEALKRSAENYLKAVELAIAKENLTGEFNPNRCTIESGITKCGDKTLNVTVDGELPDSGEIMLSNGTIDKTSETFLTYNDKDTLTYDGNNKLIFGEAKAPQPQEKYGYMWYTGSDVSGPSINGDGSSLETTLPEDKNYYLKYKLDDSNVVTKAYACVKFNGTEERCLEGGSADTYGWVTSKTDSTGIVAKIYEIEQEGISGVSCNFVFSDSNCSDGSVNLCADSDGIVNASGASGYCGVSDVGGSVCGSL